MVTYYNEYDYGYDYSSHFLFDKGVHTLNNFNINKAINVRVFGYPRRKYTALHLCC